MSDKCYSCNLFVRLRKWRKWTPWRRREDILSTSHSPLQMTSTCTASAQDSVKKSFAISHLKQIPPIHECRSSASSPCAVDHVASFLFETILQGREVDGVNFCERLKVFFSTTNALQCAFAVFVMMHHISWVLFSIFLFLCTYKTVTNFWQYAFHFYKIKFLLLKINYIFKIKYTPTYLFPYSSHALYILLSFWRLGFCNSCRDKNA